MITTFADMYWIVAGDEMHLWSSARGDYVAADDATYLAWLAAGGFPTRIANEDELADVLTASGVVLVPGRLSLYAAELSLPAYAGLSDQEAADALNTRDKRGLVPLWEVDLYRVRNGLTIPLETAKASHELTDVRNAAASALAYLSSPHVANIDMDDNDTALMLGALQLGGVLTSEQYAALNALADNRSTRCEQLGLPPATAAIVALARG